MASLAGLMRQQSPAARASMMQVVATQIESLAGTMAEGDATERRRAAIGMWSAMVGALILARSIDDPVLSEELLTATRAWIDERTTPGDRKSTRLNSSH